MKTTDDLYLEIKKEIETQKKYKITNKRHLLFGLLCIIILITTIPLSNHIKILVNNDLNMMLAIYAGFTIIMTIIGVFILPIQKKPLVSQGVFILPIQKKPLVSQEEIITLAKNKIEEYDGDLKELKIKSQKINEEIVSTENTIRNLKFVAKEFVCNL